MHATLFVARALLLLLIFGASCFWLAFINFVVMTLSLASFGRGCRISS